MDDLLGLCCLAPQKNVNFLLYPILVVWGIGVTDFLITNKTKNKIVNRVFLLSTSKKSYETLK